MVKGATGQRHYSRLLLWALGGISELQTIPAERGPGTSQISTQVKPACTFALQGSGRGPGKVPAVVQETSQGGTHVAPEWPTACLVNVAKSAKGVAQSGTWRREHSAKPMPVLQGDPGARLKRCYRQAPSTA